MKHVTIQSELTDEEMKSLVTKIIDVINHNEKPVHSIPDIVMTLGMVITSVVGSVADHDPASARTIWLNVALKVNNYLKKNIGAPIDIKIMDDKPLKE